KKALTEAKKVLRLKPSGKDIEVFLSSPQLHSITDGIVDPEEAIQRINSASIAFGSDSLLTNISTLLSEQKYNSLRVFSDKTIEHNNSRLQVEKIRGEASAQNIAISSIAIRKPENAKGRQILEVGLSSFAKEPVDLRISALPYRLNEDELLPLSNLELTTELEPFSSKLVQLQPLAENATAFRAALSIINTKDPRLNNAILEDDVAWIVLAQSSQILAVVSNGAPQLLNLGGIPSFKVQNISPLDFDKTLNELGPKSIVLFYRYVPDSLPNRNSFFVLPPPRNKLFPVQDKVERVTLSTWSNSHPLLSYINMSLFQFNEAYPIEALPWTSPIINSTSGPILIAGETNGYRYVASGFEIFPYEGGKSLSSSILLLNILKWLSNSALENGFQKTNSILQTEKNLIEAAYISTVPGINPPETLELPRPLLPFPGIVINTFDDQTVGLTAVNFFDDEESNLFFSKNFILKESTSTTVNELRSTSQLQRPILFISLLLLVIDMVLQFRSKLLGVAR
ncbi:MAG: hypothetical protein GYA55_10205, partial [SAR324 cluster bacterium]|nr:hypothetical protein [SAR324 cluster bacterium]